MGFRGVGMDLSRTPADVGMNEDHFGVVECYTISSGVGVWNEVIK